MIGERGRKAPEDHLLGFPVEVGHEVDGPFEHDLAALVRILPEESAGFPGRSFGRFEKLAIPVHSGLILPTCPSRGNPESRKTGSLPFSVGWINSLDGVDFDGRDVKRRAWRRA